MNTASQHENRVNAPHTASSTFQIACAVGPWLPSSVRGVLPNEQTPSWRFIAAPLRNADRELARVCVVGSAASASGACAYDSVARRACAGCLAWGDHWPADRFGGGAHAFVVGDQSGEVGFELLG